VEAPGVVRNAGSGVTRLGPHDEATGEAFRTAAVLLAAAGMAPEVHREMRPYVWQKALVNHAINPVAAAAGVTNGKVLDEPLRGQAAALLEEGFSLSRAAGVPIPGGLQGLQDALWSTLERTRGNRCSMLQDVSARRPTEVEQISGRLVRLARRLGYPMFALEEAYHRIKGLESAYLGDDGALAMTRAELMWENASF
jgi:2-dehydropantoate 2-reductase